MELNNNKSQKTYADMILEKLPLLLAFLMPVFFLPTTLEFFEFNKLILLTIATIIMTISWIIKIMMSKKIGATKSIMDLPMFLFVLTLALSTIFSINKDSSIFGSQGRWFPSLFGALVVYGFYYVLTSNIKSIEVIKNSLYALVTGISISSVIGILSYFNIFVGNANYLKTPGFTLTGSITTTAILSAICTVLAVNLLLNEKILTKKPLLLVAILINYFVVVSFGLISTWVILAIGIVSTILFTKTKTLTDNKFFISTGLGVVLAVTAIFFIPNTKELVTNANFPKEITLPVKASWLVASSVVQDYPTLATGPSTFYINFPRYRPLFLNSTNLWNVRFDKSYNEIFNVMATMGIIGLGTMVFLGVRTAKLALTAIKTKDENDGLANTLGIALLTSTAVLLVTYATVLNTFIIVLLMALLVVYISITKRNSLAEKIDLSLSTIASVTTIGDSGAIKKEYLHYVLVTPLVALVIYTGWVTYKLYAAEAYMRSSVIAAQQGDGGKTYNYQTKAISMNPQRDAYRNAYIQTNLVLANSIAAKQDITEEEIQTVRQLIAQAISNSRATTEVLNPLNVTNWETRANTYRAITGVADNAGEWSINAYNTAIQLNQTDPRLRLDLGGIYFAAGDYLTAANSFRQAVLLKQDYANGHYNFAQALLKLEDVENARRELEITKALIPEGSQDYQAVVDQLAQLPAATEASKPTVEELESIVSDGSEEKVQEPLAPANEKEPNIDNANLEVENVAPTDQPTGTTPNEQNQNNQ